MGSNTIQLTRLKGSAREMGRMQGSQCKEQIGGVRDILVQSEPFEIMKPWFLPKGLFIWLASRVAHKHLSKSVSEFLPDQWERILGIAEGAEADLKFLLLLHGMEIELDKVDFVLPGACSAMGVAAERSADGEPIIVKNFDYPAFLDSLYIARLNEQEGRLRSLDVSAAPIAGNHDGVNEAGLAIAYNYGCGQDQPVESIPITLIVQEALDKCETVSQAVELFSRMPRAGNALLMLADAKGDMCTLELSNLRHAVRKPEKGILINTNHYLTDEVKAVDTPHDAVYSKRNVQALRGLRVHKSSEARYDQIARQSAALEKLTVDHAMGIFSSHGDSPQGSDDTVCRHGPFYSTTCSMVLLPARREMRVTWGNPCQNAYSVFNL